METQTLQTEKPRAEPLSAKGNPAQFFTLFKGVAEIQPEQDQVELVFTLDKLSITTMGFGQAGMVIASIPTKQFSKYTLPDNKETKLGINIQALLELLPKKGRDITLTSRAGGITIIQDGDIPVELGSVPIIEVKPAQNKEPHIEATALWQINTTTFREALKAASGVGSHIVVATNQENLEISIEKHDNHMDKLFKQVIRRIYFSFSNLTFSCTGSEPIKSQYDIGYLIALTSMADKKGHIEIAYKANDPVRVEYNSNEVSFRYYLAPYSEQ